MKKSIERSRQIWDSCATSYEKKIVNGHPDITAFEEFEMDFLDYILAQLSIQSSRFFRIIDLGCGSGRVTRHYNETQRSCLYPDFFGLKNLPLWDQKRLRHIFGMDFSKTMIRIARKKIGEQKGNTMRCQFEQGNVFDLPPFGDELVPLVICLINTIGVMQGEEGAVSLFKKMRELTEKKDGVALISCYRQDYLESYGLGQYESTMQVSGQPKWLIPNKYASSEYTLQPKAYIRAHSGNNCILTDVVREDHKEETDYPLYRDPQRVEQVLNSGHILTYSGYESNWYSVDKISDWIAQFWTPFGRTQHILTADIDPKRAEPGQMAIFDPGDRLSTLFRSY